MCAEEDMKNVKDEWEILLISGLKWLHFHLITGLNYFN